MVEKEFTVSYPFRGSQWGLTILATDHAEAVERLKALAWAKIDGEVMMTLKAETGAEVVLRPAKAALDPIERGILGVANGVFRVLNGYCRWRNWLVKL